LVLFLHKFSKSEKSSKMEAIIPKFKLEEINFEFYEENFEILPP